MTIDNLEAKAMDDLRLFLRQFSTENSAVDVANERGFEWAFLKFSYDQLRDDILWRYDSDTTRRASLKAWMSYQTWRVAKEEGIEAAMLWKLTHG